MSVYVQSLKNGKFAQGPAQWTDDVKHAQDFAGGVAALLYCHLHHLNMVQVVGRFDNPQENFRIPLRSQGVE
jgi:hypothetical protein